MGKNIFQLTICLLKKTTVQTKKKGFDIRAVNLAVLKAVDVLAGIMLWVGMAIPTLEIKTSCTKTFYKLEHTPAS